MKYPLFLYGRHPFSIFRNCYFDIDKTGCASYSATIPLAHALSLLHSQSHFFSYFNRSTSISTAISWILLLVTTILLNIEILLPSSIGYMCVLIPTYIIITIWFIVSIYIIFGLTVQVIKIHF